MDFITIDQTVIVGTFIGVLIGTMLMRIFVFKTKQVFLSWRGILVIDLVLAGLIYYYQSIVISYLNSTAFLPIFIVFILLYTAVLIWYFKIQKDEKIKKNMNWFEFFSLLYIGFISFLFTNELQQTFNFLNQSILFIIMLGSFVLAFLVYFVQINKNKTAS